MHVRVVHVDLRGLIIVVREFLPVISKAKGAKLFRAVVDGFLATPGELPTQVPVHPSPVLMLPLLPHCCPGRTLVPAHRVHVYR